MSFLLVHESIFFLDNFSRNMKEMLLQRDEKVIQFMNLSKKLAKIEAELNNAQENNIGIKRQRLRQAE